MAQHDYNLANALAANFRGDANNALLAIVSQNSGASEPAETFAHMFWYDTTNSILKMRNAGDDAWIDLIRFDQSGDQAFMAGKSVTRTLLTSGVSATYNPPTGVRALRVFVCGGGGGGGGVNGQAGISAGQGGGGAGGTTTEKLITSPASSYIYTVGSGGAGSTVDNVASNGGDSSFTDGGSVNVVGPGGGGGTGMIATTGNAFANKGVASDGTGGDRYISGESGIHGRVSGGATVQLWNGAGSYFSSGIRGLVGLSANGLSPASDQYGAGGVGAAVSQSTTNYTGGNGAPGVIEIWEIY